MKSFVSLVVRAETVDITVLEAAEPSVVEVADMLEVDQVVVTKVVDHLVEVTREAEMILALSVHDTETIVLRTLQAEDIREAVPKVVLHTETIALLVEMLHAQLVVTRPQKDHLVGTREIALQDDTKVVNVLLVEVTKEVVLSLIDFEAELTHSVTSDSIRAHPALLLLATREAVTNPVPNVRSSEAENERIEEATRKEHTKLLVIETMLEEPRKHGQAVRKKTSNK